MYPKNMIPIAEVRKFIIIFFSVGVLGFIIPFSKPLFITITPFALLLNTYLLAVFHPHYGPKDLIIFLFIFFCGFTLEVIGVNYGLIFGHYSYGSALGIKLFSTPIMIGINWLFLTYSASSLTTFLKLNKWLSILIAPIFMLIYDIVLEQVAPKMDMWHWQDGDIPIQNYIAWYLIALCFVFLIKTFKIKTKNPMGPILFVCQFIFFLFLNVLL